MMEKMKNMENMKMIFWKKNGKKYGKFGNSKFLNFCSWMDYDMFLASNTLNLELFAVNIHNIIDLRTCTPFENESKRQKSVQHKKEKEKRFPQIPEEKEHCCTETNQKEAQ